MAEIIKRFSPFFLQKFPGSNRDEIIDRNLLAIQQALEQANVTITKQQTTINRIINGDTTVVITGAQGPPGLDASDAEGDEPMSIPGSPGARGRDGTGVPGLDGDDGDVIVIPGPAGRPGRDGGAAMLFGDQAEDQAEAFVVPPQAPIVWPSRQSVLISSGTNTKPTAGFFFEYDFANDIIQIGDDASFALYLTGKNGTGNYERLRLFDSGASSYTLKSEKGGTGTVRSLTIDVDTATLTLNAATAINLTSTTGISIGTAASTAAVTMAAGTSVTISAGTGTHPSALFQQSQLTVDTSVALTAGFPAGSTWNGLNITGSATVPGTGTITAAFASTKFVAPTITGTGVGATVNEAATVLIAGGPIGSGLSVNVKYALWVQADVARFDGTMMFPTVANGAVATALTSVGPVGSHTTVQKWFKFQDSATGIDYYVPGF